MGPPGGAPSRAPPRARRLPLSLWRSLSLLTGFFRHPLPPCLGGFDLGVLWSPPSRPHNPRPCPVALGATNPSNRLYDSSWLCKC